MACFPDKAGKIMAHMWRWSAATQMADSGAGAFELKHAGRWRSINVAEIYVAESLARERETMKRLSGGPDVGEKKNESVSEMIILSSSNVYSH